MHAPKVPRYCDLVVTTNLIEDAAAVIRVNKTLDRSRLVQSIPELSLHLRAISLTFYKQS